MTQVALHGSSAGTNHRRLGIAEAERLPDLAAGLYDALIGVTAGDLASHIETALGLARDEAEVVANELIGLALHPALPRLLFVPTVSQTRCQR